MTAFRQYSAYYDLLYADKDYAGEADYVARTLRHGRPGVRTILELGSGTGRHGRLLAARGFEVLGVELSPEMAAIADVEGGGFRCEVGDLRSYRAGRRFDAVIALFHVISYQTGEADLAAAFATAAAHLAPGGPFLFDVWHAPAVLAQRPRVRVKEAGDERRRVRRIATPVIDEAAGVVTVAYDLDCEDLVTGERLRFGERHRLRYLACADIERLAANAGFDLVSAEEFLTGARPSGDTWGVAWLLRRAGDA